LELPSSFSGAGMKVMTWANSEITTNLQWDDNLLTLTWLTSTQEIKICDSIQWDNCTKSVSVPTTLGYSSGCKWWEIDFWTAWCVEQDANLVASWYTLVAYAPYDKLWDLNMYKAWWESITFSSWWNISFDDSNPDNKWIKIMDWTVNMSSWYLVYSWSELLLWSNFAVEMSVRGEALKRTTNNFLFNSTDSTYPYKLKTTSTTWKSLALQEWSVSPTLFFNSPDLPKDFYSIIFSKEWINWRLFIPETTYYTNISTLNSLATLWDNLYIWCYETKISQWNDIIDYVKIYKK
jgi:hypothetical protein